MIGGVKIISGKQTGLGLFRATGIYVGAILGSGILVLPAIAAREAGPASLLAWTLLLVFCVPVAFSFMSRQQPDAGGIATLSHGPTGGAPPRWPATSSTSPFPSGLRRQP
jgi:amino acid efflux transporter